jgi:hypothetical protein
MKRRAFLGILGGALVATVAGIKGRINKGFKFAIDPNPPRYKLLTAKDCVDIANRDVNRMVGQIAQWIAIPTTKGVFIRPNASWITAGKPVSGRGAVEGFPKYEGDAGRFGA